MAPVIVTGAAGFIGCEVALRLLQRGDSVIGVDSLNNYYDPALKQARLQRLDAANAQWSFLQLNLKDAVGVSALFRQTRLAE